MFSAMSRCRTIFASLGLDEAVLPHDHACLTKATGKLSDAGYIDSYMNNSKFVL
ncbi:hypothetical protein GMORB2_0369 [Geosmithia morbida]|uniref:Uncharacterized protein n=1 Tax=Geosmithia morbida TaxID=1094350 RepID=A0A9P5D3V7_9HYPO|nr:uncharacterized protein GMORB2_0369 [Geosmithia morbida]KAF4126633.1 hypothetical protein GMORB2_0369 [Geosmithia morbida]